MPLHSSLVKEWARESLALEEGAVGASGALRGGGVDEEVKGGGVSSAMVHQQKLPRADKVMAAIAERLLELLGGLAARATKAATETKAEVGSDGSNTNSDIGQQGAHAAVPPYVGRLVAITVTFRPAVTQGIATVTGSAFSGVTAAATKGVEGLAVFEETAHAVAVAAPNAHGGPQQQQQQRFFSCLWFDDDPQYAPLNVVGNHDTSASVVAAAADFVVPMAGGASTAPNPHSANAHALSLSLSPSSSSSNVPIDLVTQQQQQQRPQRPRGLAGHTSIPASSSLPLASPPHLLPLPLPYPSDVLLAVFNQSLRDSMAARRRRLFGTETPLHWLMGSAAAATAPAIAAAAIGATAGGGGSGWSWGDSFPSALSSSSTTLARGDGDEVAEEDDALGDLLGSASASMPNVPSRDGSAVPSGGTKRPLPQGAPMRGGRQRSGGGGRGRGGASAGSADSDGRYIGYWRALCSKEVSAASIPTSPVPKPKGGEEGAVTTPPPSPAPPTLSFSAATSDSNALPMPSVAQVSPPPPPLNTSTSGGGRSAVGAGRGGLKFEEVEEEHTRISAQPPRLALGGSTTAAVANSGGGGSSSRRVAATTTAAGVGVAAKRPRDSPPPSSRGPPTTAAARAVRSVTTLDVDEDEDDDVLVIE